MTYTVSGGTLNPTHSLTPPVQTQAVDIVYSPIPRSVTADPEWLTRCCCTISVRRYTIL